MAQNVTFLLGAGASFHAIPVVGQLNYRLEEFAATLESTGIFRDILPGAPPKSYVVEDEDFKEHRESCDLLASKIRKLVCDISGYLTIDTYAKKLYLQEDYDALDGLKLMLSLYFTIEQLTEKQDEEKHKKGSRIDSRYLSLFASILDKKNSQIAIPENIKFITWNYDYQLELALNVFEDKNLIRNDDNHGFNAFINLQQYQITEQTLDIVHLNGIAGVYWNRKMRKGYSQLYGGTNATDYKSVLIKTLDIFKKLDQKTASLSETFTFAWEKNQIAQNSFQVARNIMKETDVLIVIGYSFPFFNREIDKQLINSFIEADKEGKMYIQNPIDTTSFIKKQFNIQDQLDIEYIQNTEQFFLPYSL
jgi:hypothetical protein